jgi:hypothetical protein
MVLEVLEVLELFGSEILSLGKARCRRSRVEGPLESNGGSKESECQEDEDPPSPQEGAAENNRVRHGVRR